jgi:hypothetical protein
MTQLTMIMNPAAHADCEAEQYSTRDLAAHLTATVVYSLSGATIFLLATFIRSL